MRILIVEDHRKLADALRGGLADHGYAVDVTQDGEHGLELAEAAPYDLVILDVMLPGLSGFDVCRQLRSRRYGGRILMLTARDAVEDRVAGLDQGADDYLVKPFAFPELLARLRALLRRDGSSRDQMLVVGDLEMDTVARQVRRSGRLVELTGREYAVLEYLLRNHNHVVTRDQIADHVWGFEYLGGSNLIDVHVANLRRKLGDARDGRLLRTVRGVGYQLGTQADPEPR